MGRDDKCLLCFPVECGIKTLATLTILMTIGGIIDIILFEDNRWGLFWPFIVCSGIQSILWMFALGNPTESTKYYAFLGYVILIVLCSYTYYAIILFNGKLMDHLCHDEHVEQFNEATDDDVTVEECRLGGKKMVLIDFILGLILNFYFAIVIYRWSKKNDNSYGRAW